MATTLREPTQIESAPSPTPRHRRWLGRIPLLIGLLSILAWLLPAIVATTPLRNVVLNLAQPSLPPGTTVGSATLSWTGPVQLRDVRVADEAGREVLRVESIESEQSLWQLATERLSKGLFHVVRPRLTLTIRERSKRIEPAITRFLNSRPRSGKGFSLDLSGGEVVIVDAGGTVLTSITDVSVSLHRPVTSDEPGHLKLTGRVAEPDTQGRLSVEADWTGHDLFASAGNARAELDRVPLAALGRLLETRLKARGFDGEVTATLTGNWQPEEVDSVLIDADCTAPSIALQVHPASVDESPDAWQLTDSLLHGKVALDRSRSVRVDRLVVNSQPVKADLVGSVERLPGDWLIDLSGDLSSDPALLLDLLGETIRGNVDIQGLEVRRIDVHGPLSSFRSTARPGAGDAESDPEPVFPLQLQADVGWTQLAAAGFTSRDGLVAAQWHDRRLLFLPQQVDVNGGRVVSLPAVDFAGRALVVEPGPVVQDLEFTPEMCHTWLKFVSPLMADATSIDGRFSLAAESGRFPLHDLSQGEFRGTLTAHSAQVGPGPFARQAITIGQHVETLLKGELPLPFDPRPGRDRNWLVLQPQDLAFEFRDGRVHHERIEYQVGDVVVATTGSVGLDESLDLTVEIPLQDKWLGSRRALASLKGEVLRIPVTGTFEQPAVDPRPLADFNRRLAKKAAGNLLERLLDP